MHPLEYCLKVWLCRSLPWAKRDSTITTSSNNSVKTTKRRESSGDILRTKFLKRASVDKGRRGSLATVIPPRPTVTSPGIKIFVILLIHSKSNFVLEIEPPSFSTEQSTSERIRKELLNRRNSRASPERPPSTTPKLQRLRRQSTIFDEFGSNRRGSK